MVRLLLEKNDAINAKNLGGLTAMHRHGAVAQLLLEKSAAINAKARDKCQRDVPQISLFAAVCGHEQDLHLLLQISSV